MPKIEENNSKGCVLFLCKPTGYLQKKKENITDYTLDNQAASGKQ